MIQSILKNPSQAQTIKELKPTDVLCGRSKHAFNHAGNLRFRYVVSGFLRKYVDVYATRKDKAQIIQSIIDVVRSYGGTFVQICNNDDCYKELTEKQVYEKVGHAIRDMAASRQVKDTSWMGNSTDIDERNDKDLAITTSVGSGYVNDNMANTSTAVCKDKSNESNLYPKVEYKVRTFDFSESKPQECISGYNFQQKTNSKIVPSTSLYEQNDKLPCCSVVSMDDYFDLSERLIKLEDLNFMEFVTDADLLFQVDPSVFDKVPNEVYTSSNYKMGQHTDEVQVENLDLLEDDVDGLLLQLLKSECY